MGLYGQGDYGAGLYSSTLAVTATEDSAWPPRLLVEVTGLTVDDDVTLYRIQGANRTAVRAGSDLTVDDTVLLLNDGEYPYGILISYLVNVNGSDGASSSTMTITLPGGNVAVSDAITGLSAETIITAWPEKDNTRTGTAFDVGGAAVFVSAPRGSNEQQVEFLTLTDTSRQQMIALLDGTTSGIILIRQPGGYAGIDGTYSVRSDNERRITQRGTDQRRLWTLDLVDSKGWAPSLADAGWTLADIEDAYAGLTLADLAADFATLLDIAIFDWGLA